MNPKEIILIVEDEKNIAAFMKTLLISCDYDVLHADTGKMAVSMAASYSPDLILLDLGLPDIDGLEVLRRIREWSDIPVIIVSARQTEQEKVLGLDSGANDYITKPFGNDELLARIRAAGRIHKRIKSSRSASVFQNGNLLIDYEKRLVTMNGNLVHLTPLEYKIVILFSQNAGKVLTHDFMIHNLWGPYASDSQVLRVNVANIRRKLEANPADPVYIITEVGVGYRMRDIAE